MASPFLLREVLDVAIPRRDTTLLTLLVAGMIGVSVATGVLGVAQTWLSNVVGQRVMHDLRTAVYRHLQRLSLAFFTRTRTGEVQSRIANDIGGVQNNVTTVSATIVAMVALDWRLAAFSLGLLPVFVAITRKVGTERKKITSERQGRLADMSSLVEESLSVSGILLGKTMGRSPELADRFEAESAELADLEVRSRMAGRWRMSSVQMSFAVMPALVYWFAGQTTLGYLVARLYDTTAGRVTIDGVDVRDLSFAALARTVGLVSQETYLFHATIRENLRFAKPDASDEELEAAARAAQIHALIASLPEGYDTIVGERGYRFSGGEKQRIAIARTVLRNPPVLVLDEATSALDNETEHALQEALDALARGRTTIAIAHRLSTVRDADQIVVLDGGRIVERGTHAELLARGGRYAALAARAGEADE